MPVSLELLRSPVVSANGQDYDLLPHKPVCLLVYLGYQGTWVSREVLAALFWPEDDEASARHNLRMLLSRAKQLPWAKDVETETTRLRWRVQTDVTAFTKAVGKGDWEKVAALHQTPLLGEWRLTDMPGVEAWLELERETLLGTWREAVLTYSHTLHKQSDYTRAAELLKKLHLHDPLAEDVLALYLENAYLAGHRDDALKTYEAFKKHLAKDLDLEPLEETVKLAETIRRAERVQKQEVIKEDRVPLSVLRPPKLIGREKEQRALASKIDTVVMISGEPGVGKSRFLSDVLPTARVLRCREGLSNVSYFPLADYVRSHVSALPDLGPYRADLARLVPEVLPSVSSAPDPQTAKLRLSEALAFVLENEAAPVFFEDVQWADSATLEFLVFLAVRGRLRIYGSYRSSELNDTLAATLKSLRGSRLLGELKLEPLTREDVRALLASLRGAAQASDTLASDTLTSDTLASDTFSDWLAKRSGGNPFFALETLKNLFDSGLLEFKDDTWHSRLDDLTHAQPGVPGSVSDLVTRRLEQLSDAARRVLQAASVMQQGFSPKTLSQIVGLSEWGVVEALEETEANNLTHGDTFQHDLLRQSIYAALPPVRRTLLHTQVARILAQDTDPAVVAAHYQRGGDKRNALLFYRRAADAYVAKGLHAEAKTLLSNLVLQVSEEEKLELQTRLATICVELGAHAEAETHLTALFNTILTPRLRADALFAKAALLFHQGKVAEVAELLVELSELDIDYSEQDRYQLIFLRSQVAFYQNQYAEVKKILTPLLAQLKRKTASHELVKTLTDLGVSYDQLGESEAALKHHREALRVAKAVDARHLQVVIANNLLWGAVTTGRVKPVLPEAEKALGLGEYAATMTLRNNLARAYFSLGQNDEAKYHYEAITRSSQDPTLLSIAWARLAELYQRGKNSQGMKKALGEAIHLLPQTQFSVAHLSVGLAVATHGTDAQIRAVMPFLEPHLSTEAGQEVQKRLEQRS
jgi:DNA-binding SARP family transcriptional activator